MIDWRTVQPGDVVRSRSGLLRVVRSVKRFDPTKHHRSGKSPARGTFVTFVIQHCSWTHRPCTSYTVGELNQLRYTATGARFSVNSEFDRLLKESQEARNSAESPLDCCDVRGIA